MVSRKALAVAVVAGVVAAVIAGTAIAYAQSYTLGKGAGWGKGWPPWRSQAPPPWSNATLPVAKWLHKEVAKEFKDLIGPRVEVSEEYRSRVLEILSRDEDVAKLLSEGYNVTSVRPVIKAYIAADGTVALKASQALVTLVKNGERLPREHYVVVNGSELVRISPDAVRVARYLSVVQKVVDRNPEVLKDLEGLSLEYRKSRNLEG